MNCPSMHQSMYLHSQRRVGVLDFFRSVLTGLRDTEQGFFARLSHMLSNSMPMEKSKVQLSWLASKISQCVVAAALFLPPKFFIGYLIVMVITTWIERKKFSMQCIGVLLGLVLMKCCIELVLFLLSINTGVAPEALPGHLYVNYTEQHSWMFILNGMLFVPFTINFFMALPVILLVAVVFKLTFFQLFLLIAGFLFGLSIKSFGQSRPLRGAFSGVLQENSVFHFLWFLWVVVAIFAATMIYPQLLSETFIPQYLLATTVFLGILALLSVVCFDVANPHGIVMMDVFRSKSMHGDKLLYKYSKKMFKETAIGMEILMNEIRKYSAKQSIYFEKTMTWYENKLIELSDIERIHAKFRKKAEELKDYLVILQKSQDITLYEDNVIICSKFLEGANSLENNFYEKCKLLEAEQDEEKKMDHNPFFSAVIESDDAVFFLYESVLKSMDKDEMDSLAAVLEHRGSVLKDIEQSYISTRQDLVPEKEKQLALELVNLYQINLWQIGKQNELLQHWVTQTVKYFADV